jgi:hypothetical protein
MKYLNRLLLLYLLCGSLYAQSLEPRLYSNAPVGLNFLVMGYSYSSGALPNIPELGLVDPNLKVDTAVLAYARVFEAFGMSGKIDCIVPFAKVYGTAYDEEQNFLTRNVKGLADMKVRLSYNFFGAPALSMKEYASYKQDLIIGASIQLTMPTGKYDASRLVNISANRWAIKPSFGLSKAVGSFIFEADIDAEFYTKNSHYYANTVRKQNPLYSTQAHIIYNLKHGAWFGLNANYFWGGDYTIDEKPAHKRVENSRLGITAAFPINNTNSIKLYGSRGVVSRIGTNFDIVGFAWQYHWF